MSTSNIKVSIIGLGFVGSAMLKSFSEKINDSTNSQSTKYTVYGYDKYKSGGVGTLDSCIGSQIIFTALPTLYDETMRSYDNTPTVEVLTELTTRNFNGIIVIKSTTEPSFTEELSTKFPTINFIHNPEFLTARTAYEDFHNQKHIVLGKSKNCSDEAYKQIMSFYSCLYPDASISECTSIESESVKIYCNTFYAIKIQYFNELYLLSEKTGADFNVVVDIMLKNKWINPMHTKVPGTDGKLSYGGLCFPKDATALNEFMKKRNSPSAILSACVQERNIMRPDADNVKPSQTDFK